MNKILKKIAITTILIIFGLGNYSLAAITSVNVDFAQNKIIIKGEAVAYPITDSLLVSLGDINLVVCPSCYSETEIIADIPAGLTDGDYMLRITALGRRYIDSDPGSLSNEYNLTVGAVGAQGIQGEPGLPGADGQDGTDGAQGIQGIQGEKGDKGDPGIQGIQGIKGDKGDKGDPGIQGIQGVKGDKGDKGDQGDPGIQGLRGLPGADGVDGEAGNLALAGQVCSGTAVPKGFDSNGDIVCGYTSSTAVNYGRGKAIVPHWSSDSGLVTVIYLSNISEHTINVSVTFYRADGSIVSTSDYNNFINNNTQIASNNMGKVRIITSTHKQGYAVIEWQNTGTDNDDVALVAYGLRVVAHDSYRISYVAIPINNGLPF